LGRAARTPHKYRDWTIEENAMRIIFGSSLLIIFLLLRPQGCIAAPFPTFGEALLIGTSRTDPSAAAH
jgi:hypothetical protein